MRHFGYLVVLLTLLIGVTSCARPDLGVAPVSVSDNPTDKIAELSGALAEARVNQLHVLSPGWYAEAEDYLGKARSGLASKASVGEVLQDIAYGQASLDKAEGFADIARSALDQAVKARSLAIAAGAQVFGADFQNVEDDFIALTKDIENDNLSRAQKNEKKVVEDFSELELRAIKENALGGVRRLLADTEADGARAIAPKTLTDARQALDDAEMYINHQRHNSDRIGDKASKAMFQTQRLEQVMATARQVKGMSPEEIALWNESFLQQITGKLGAADVRNESPQRQVQNITEAISGLQEDKLQLLKQSQQETTELEGNIQQLQAALSAQKERAAQLEGESAAAREERERIARQERETKARLEAERRFQQLFNEVQVLFEEDEADVYKQAGNLVIRLKTMQFPVGKALIMPENYALLNKVRSAIGTFGSPSVVIEGHTDSTGSAAINEKLSRDRAEAVRQYFIANGTLQEDAVTAVGYGPTRPLATNNTAEGRAINRRIDVIVKPMETAE